MLEKLKIQNFKTLLSAIKRKESEDASRHLILYRDGHLVARHQSCNSCFCKAVVASGYLNQQQMQHAVERYHLGLSRDGGVIFWQMDHLGTVYDGKIMYYRTDCHRDHHHNPTWVSAELKRFYEPTFDIPTSHCLFGTHLLMNDNDNVNENEIISVLTKLNTQNSKQVNVNVPVLTPKGMSEQSSLPVNIAVVEAEKTAVILSELYPQCLWMASGGLEALRPESLFPLRGHRIILFPDTDESGATYTRWYDISRKASRLLGQPITVSSLLEQRATPDQKRRKIDLVDFLFPPP